MVESHFVNKKNLENTRCFYCKSLSYDWAVLMFVKKNLLVEKFMYVGEYKHLNMLLKYFGENFRYIGEL